MKRFKKISLCCCLTLAFCGNYVNVRADSVSADEYYNRSLSYGYYQPYDAIKELSQAYKAYPQDKRFTKSLDDKAKLILSWSKGSQLNGKYDGAIYGYKTIMNTEGISKNIKREANICLKLAERREPAIPGRIELQDQYDNVSKYYNEYLKANYEYQRIGYYDSFKEFLFVENSSSYSNNEEIKFDSQGIPMVNYSGNYYYNPINIAQYALASYDKYLRNDSKTSKIDKENFLNAANWLKDNLDVLGALRYKFNYKHYLNESEFQSGWVSSMAQGHALSVFARAYHLTNNREYIEAGNNAFRYLTVKVSNGGVMDGLERLNKHLKNQVFFQLYVTQPASYTLNGDMYTLLGVYDWSNVSNNNEIANEAKGYFNQGLKTLKYLLPYYDIGGFVAYDLGYLTKPGIKPTVNLSYYGAHLTLLEALYRITKDETFEEYRSLWTSYIENN